MSATFTRPARDKGYDVEYDDVIDTLPVCRNLIVLESTRDRTSFTFLETASVDIKEGMGCFRAREMMCY